MIRLIELEKELLPCPFCGCDYVRMHKHAHPKSNKEFYTVGCFDCGATFPGRYRPQLLIDVWNNRKES